VREGKVSCADCHNVHGSPGPKLVKEFTINETCYNCHAEKRGPFLWEHQPVRENCDNCHTPHGSPQAAMLTERQPYLCASCHSNNGNHSGGWFGGAASLPGHSPSNVVLNNELNNRSCLNCHSNIHGTNSPGGQAFLR
jgi:DmsE family decaheme c-type cytochrome